MDTHQGDGVNHVWRMVTDFADIAVTGPLAVLLVAYLVLVARRHRLAAGFIVAVAGTGAAMLLLKLILRTCLGDAKGVLIYSPSGHAAMSMAVYGGFALLASLKSVQRWPVLATALLAVGLIGVSRVVLAAHNPAEVVIGVVVGGVFTTLLAWLIRDEGALTRHRWPMLVLAVCSIVLTYGLNLPAEETIRNISLNLRGHLFMCK